MACTVSFVFTFGGPPGARFLQIDAVNAPLFCELEFFIDTTTVNTPLNYDPATGNFFFPADGLHGGPPNVNFFSNWRISVPVSDGKFGIFPAFVLISGSGPAQNRTYSLTPPAAQPQNVAVPFNTPTTIVLTATDGGDCGVTTFSIISGPTHGVLTGTPPNSTYTPDAGFIGSDSFVFQATGCGASSQATVSISVAAGGCNITVLTDASSGGNGCTLPLSIA